MYENAQKQERNNLMETTVFNNIFQFCKKIISGLDEQNGQKKLRHLWQKGMFKIFCMFKKWPVGPGPRAKIAIF